MTEDQLKDSSFNLEQIKRIASELIALARQDLNPMERHRIGGRSYEDDAKPILSDTAAKAIRAIMRDDYKATRITLVAALKALGVEVNEAAA